MSNLFGSVGRQMLNQGMLWLSLGFSKEHPLIMDLTKHGNAMVLFSPSSDRQFNILREWYRMQLSSLKASIIIDCNESSHNARKALKTALAGDYRHILIVSPCELFHGVSDARKTLIMNDLRMLASCCESNVIMMESFRENNRLIGEFAEFCDTMMTVGGMTPLYSQIAFGSNVASDIRGKWDAAFRHPDDGVIRFSLKNRIPVNTAA